MIKLYLNVILCFYFIDVNIEYDHMSHSEREVVNDIKLFNSILRSKGYESLKFPTEEDILESDEEYFIQEETIDIDWIIQPT